MTTTKIIDHAATAAALDNAYAAMVTLDALLALSGARSWQPPRTHALNAFGELHHLRDQLHKLAAGPGLASAYRTCATVAAPSSLAGEIAGPSPRQTDTGDDDRPASAHNGLAIGPSSAELAPACCAPSIESIPTVHPEADELTGPHFASEAVSAYPDKDV